MKDIPGVAEIFYNLRNAKIESDRDGNSENTNKQSIKVIIPCFITKIISTPHEGGNEGKYTNAVEALTLETIFENNKQGFNKDNLAIANSTGYTHIKQCMLRKMKESHDFLEEHDESLEITMMES